jgi:predicted XRE-type DNA-binding protein
MPRITAEPSSGNVFADIGVPDPDVALAKARVASMIYETIKARKLTQVNAAKLMGVDQPKVSEIVRGKVRGYTLDRLLGCLVRLGQPVELTFPAVTARPRRATTAKATRAVKVKAPVRA